MNLALAPRQKRCALCNEVTAIEDVTWRLLDAEGNTILKGTREAAQYLRSIGMAGTPQALLNRLVLHRRHVLRWFRAQRIRAMETGVETDGVVVPMQVENGVQRIPPPTGDVRWLDVMQSGMDLGSEALRQAMSRLTSGDMEDKDVISLAKLGVTTATTRANIELKGRKASGIDELLKLAAGMPQDGG